jgi:hypothetical protein
MDASEKPYKRLPGTGYRYTVPLWAIILLFFAISILVLLLRGRRVQLWQGKDHLLMVDWDGYREHYRRFGYSDIQAFIIRKTQTGKIVNSILSALIVLVMLPAFSSMSADDFLTSGIIGGVIALFLTVNIVLGPTCKCYIQTAVQCEVAPSLDRLRRARTVIGILRPLIVAAQGELAPGEAESRMLGNAASIAASVPAPSPVPAAVEETTTGGLPQMTPVADASTRQYVQDDPDAPPRITS